MPLDTDITIGLENTTPQSQPGNNPAGVNPVELPKKEDLQGGPSPRGFSENPPAPESTFTSKKQTGYTDSSGELVGNSRASEVRTESGDDQKTQVGLYDIDEAIYYYFEHIIQPTVSEGETEIRVPVIYGSPERWKSVQKSGVFRDETGKIQLPLIMYRRVGVEKNRELARNLDSNHPNLFVSFQKNYSPRNRYDNFEVLSGRSPSRKFHRVVIPDYVRLSYECIIWTDFIDHQNRIVEDINYASDSYWGKPDFFKFLATLDSFDIANELEQGNDRMAKATFNLTLSGYIIPNNLQKEIDGFSETSYGIAEVNLETKVVDDINNLPNK